MLLIFDLSSGAINVRIESDCVQMFCVNVYRQCFYFSVNNAVYGSRQIRCVDLLCRAVEASKEDML